MAYDVKLTLDRARELMTVVLHEYDYDGLPEFEKNGSTVTLYDPYAETYNSAHVYCTRILPFDNGSTVPDVGEVISNSSHGSGTVKAVCVESGSWAGNDAAGYFTLAYKDSSSNDTNEHFSVDNAQIDNDTDSVSNIATVNGKQLLIVTNFGGLDENDTLEFANSFGGGVTVPIFMSNYLRAMGA